MSGYREWVRAKEGEVPGDKIRGLDLLASEPGHQGGPTEVDGQEVKDPRAAQALRK